MTRPVLLDLPKGGHVLLDEDSLPLVRHYNWFRTANGYVGAMTVVAGRRTMALIHRVITNAPPGTHVDHINGNKLDNQRANLRVVSNQVNQANRQRLNKNNTSGSRGVARRSHLSPARPWLAQITVNRKNVYLGVYATREEAVAVRKAAELAYFGELCP